MFHAVGCCIMKEWVDVEWSYIELLHFLLKVWCWSHLFWRRCEIFQTKATTRKIVPSNPSQLGSTVFLLIKWIDNYWNFLLIDEFWINMTILDTGYWPYFFLFSSIYRIVRFVVVLTPFQLVSLSNQHSNLRWDI